jgi:hypothetical protein
MDCLKNFIQIEGCNAPVYSYDANTDADDNPDTDPTSASGLFINKDLPSISLENIDKLADSEQKTFLGVWDEVQDRGIRKFRIRVKTGYKELFGICNVEDDWFCDNRQALAMPLLYFLGAELMIERIYSSRINRWTTNIDKQKAIDLRGEFEDEFITQLKSALEIIDDGADNESGDVFSYAEVLP